MITDTVTFGMLNHGEDIFEAVALQKREADLHCICLNVTTRGDKQTALSCALHCHVKACTRCSLGP